MNKLHTDRQKRSGYHLLFMVICFFLFPIIGQAEEMQFYPEPKYPDNQLSRSGYFDLLMKPGQKQTIEINLVNNGEKTIKVKPVIKVATTNTNGVVEYGEAPSKPDKTLEHSIEKIVKPIDKVVEVEAKKSKPMRFEVSMPSQSFDGILVGGITIMDDNQKENTSAQAGMNINNQFAYAIAVVLRESKTPVKSDLVLGKVKADQNNARNVVSATLRNTKPKYLNQMKVDAKVYQKRNDKDTVLHSIKSDMQMAPNSYFKYPIPYNGKYMRAGKYMLDMTVTAGKDDKWHFKREFTITRSEANKYNDKDVSVEPEKDNKLWIIIAIVIAVVIVVLLIIYMIHNRRKKQELEAKLAAKSSGSSGRKKKSSRSKSSSTKSSSSQKRRKSSSRHK